jgi:hypothetical protein
MSDFITQNLLTEVYSIRNKYEEIAKLTGENFNVFDILNRTAHENSHSAFIAELLNPKGSHGCSHAFLNLFIDRFIKDKLPEFAGINIEVYTEHFIGFKKIENIENDDLPEFSGRVDILLKNVQNKNLIIIENKIDAPDQKEQLKRYHNYGESQPGLFKLFYLTKYLKESESAGNLKSNMDSKNENPDYFCLSYKQDIISWLNDCIKEAANFPIIRESINQYINLIKKLTNQSKRNEMSIEIIEKILTSEANYSAAKSIAGEFENAKIKLLTEFWQEVKNELEEKLNTGWHLKFKREKENEINIREWSPALVVFTNVQNVFIWIEPLNGRYLKTETNSGFLYFGIFHKNGEKPLEQLVPFSDCWKTYKETKYNFNDEGTLCLIINPKSRKTIKDDIVSQIVHYSQEKIVTDYLEKPM